MANQAGGNHRDTKRPAPDFRQNSTRSNHELQQRIRNTITNRVHELRSEGVTAQDIIDRDLGLEDHSTLSSTHFVSANHISDWVHRATPPAWLWQDLSRALWGDPLEFYRRIGIMPSEGDLVDQTDALIHEVLSLQHRLTQLRKWHNLHVAEHEASPSIATGAIVSRLCQLEQGEWQVAVTPGYEGPPGYLMHVTDRLDFRKTDRTPVPHDSDSLSIQLERLLADEFGTFDVVASPNTPGRWVDREDTSKNDDVVRYSVDHIQRQTTPHAPTPYTNLRSVSVVSGWLGLWAQDTAAVLARLLGFGFTSTRALGKTGFGFGTVDRRREQAVQVHHQLMTQPWRRYVWGHAVESDHPLDLLPDVSPAPPDHLTVLLLPYPSDSYTEEKQVRIRSRCEALRAHALLLQSKGMRILIEETELTPNPRDLQGRKARRSDLWQRTFVLAHDLMSRMLEVGVLDSADIAFARDQLRARSTMPGSINYQILEWGAKNTILD